jgi:hypothetical protein
MSMVWVGQLRVWIGFGGYCVAGGGVWAVSAWTHDAFGLHEFYLFATDLTIDLLQVHCETETDFRIIPTYISEPAVAKLIHIPLGYIQLGSPIPACH